ncbi:MAG TPA: DUF2917 domain-containing protein [Desulfomonilia bacterium]|nr:DUF2917 domain-containing protein [Desulfomonilia bacterium]
MEHDVMRVGKGHVMRISGAASGCTVSCLSGVLWLTRENDPEDYIITAGSPLDIKGPGLNVIEAVTDCAFSITPCVQGGVHDLA